MNLKRKIAGTYGALLLITGLATAAQPMHYAYMDTDWYKTQGVHIERAEEQKRQARTEQEKQNQERKRLLDAKAIGLYVSNTTEYPCQVTLKIFYPRPTPKTFFSGFPDRTVEKSIPAGATVELLDNALDKNYLYTLTAFVGDKPVRMLGGGVMRIGKPMAFGRDSKQAPVAKIPNLSTNKDWSIQNPTHKKVELVLELVQKQGAQPEELRLRDR